MTAAYRGVASEGYRDIFTISRTGDGQVSIPKRASKPIWKIQGCPVSGPTFLGDSMVWRDSSLGYPRILATGKADPEEVAVSDSTWVPLMSPKVSGQNWTFVPGEPLGRTYERVDGEWKLWNDAIPSWATSIASAGGRMYLVGAPEGKLRIEVVSTALQ